MYESLIGLPIDKCFLFAQAATGLCMYFLRNSAEDVVTSQTIAKEVNYGFMDCSGNGLLKSCETYMTKLMIPVLKSQEVVFH